MRIGLIGTPLHLFDAAGAQHPLASSYPGIDIRMYPSWVPTSFFTSLEQAMQVLGHADAALSAVEDGCDVVVVDSVGDHGLAVMRAILPVPVIGPGQLGLREASRDQRRFGIVTIWPESMNFILVDRMMADQCEARCVGIVNVGPEQEFDALSRPQGALALMSSAHDVLVENVRASIPKLVALGAEAVMLGSTCMFDLAEAVADHAHVPIVNPLIVAMDAALAAKPLGQRPQVHRQHERMLREMVDAVAHEHH